MSNLKMTPKDIAKRDAIRQNIELFKECGVDIYHVKGTNDWFAQLMADHSVPSSETEVPTETFFVVLKDKN